MISASLTVIFSGLTWNRFLFLGLRFMVLPLSGSGLALVRRATFMYFTL